MVALLVSAAVLAPKAYADAPEPPPLPTPDPAQQCAWIAYRLWMPCNWVMPTPPPKGTPGSLS